MTRKLIISLALLLQAVIAPAQTQRWWGVYTGDAALSYTGLQSAETYNCAMQCQASRAILSGATIHGVRFYLRDKTNVTDVKVWLSSTLPASADKANIQVIDVPQAQLADLDHDGRMVQVSLPTPYTFSGSNIYVGYTFTVTAAKTDADKNPVVCTGKGNGATGSFHLRTSKSLPSWNNLMSQYGALTLQLLVSNASLPLNAVQPQTPGRLVSLVGQTAAATLTVASAGLNEVQSLDYVVTVGGTQQPEAHYDLPASLWAPGSTATLPLTLQVPATSGQQTYSVQITKVNGTANQAAAATATAPLYAVDRLGTRCSVVEEYTGTWCTNCPRGTVGLDNLTRDFADRIVPIAVHNQDPMALAAYQQLVPDGIPRCSMDRALTCDPYLGTAGGNHYRANEAFLLMLDQPTEADLALTATWADAAQTAIRWQATTTFHLNAAQADYALAFILTADGLTGTGKDWWQVNGESGRNDYPDADMDRFRNAPDPVTDISYNHVAVAVKDIVSGISGSIAAPIFSGHPQVFTYESFSISGNSLVQDKSRLQACVLLVSTTTGQVINAARTAIGSTDPSGITAMPPAAQQAQQQWVTLSGQRTAAPTRSGLYLLNGKKIIIHK